MSSKFVTADDQSNIYAVPDNGDLLYYRDEARDGTEVVSAARRRAVHAVRGLSHLASTHMSAATGHADRQARNTVAALVACALITVITVGELAGGSSHAAGSPGASAPRSRAPDASATAAARVFSSRVYGYTVALPAGWSAQPGQHWGGTGESGPVDVFRGPPYVAAWAFAVPRPASPAAYATAITQTAAQLPCPAAVQTSQAVTIGGVAARLIGMSCPSQGGVFMLTAAATHNQTALVVVFEDSSGVKAAEHADRAVFRALLVSIRFRR